MTEFTATNGFKVKRPGLPGELRVTGEVTGVGITPAEAQALREFFQHERDEALGRWRWPENPDYVVTPFETRPDHVLVVQENAGVACEFWRTSAEGPAMSGYHSLLAPAARAYFAAHSEPKPWHDAKPGEVWVLTSPKINGGDEFAFGAVVALEGIRFSNAGGSIHLDRTDESITAGRRIWPEE